MDIFIICNNCCEFEMVIFCIYVFNFFFFDIGVLFFDWLFYRMGEFGIEFLKLFCVLNFKMVDDYVVFNMILNSFVNIIGFLV